MEELEECFTLKTLSEYSPEERTKIINRSRNYVRWRMSLKGIHFIHIRHPEAFTADERYLIDLHNQRQQQIYEILHGEDMRILNEGLTAAKIHFFTKFYENCSLVNSTLKKKEK